MRSLAFVLLLSGLVCLVESYTSIDLSKEDWTLTNANGSIKIATQVPSYALNELTRTGIIGDPLYG